MLIFSLHCVFIGKNFTLSQYFKESLVIHELVIHEFTIKLVKMSEKGNAVAANVYIF